MRDLSLRQLRAVIAIAKSGKIVSAASELGLTPPAVTEQLRLLETNFGIHLFDRTSAGLRPTDAGRLILDLALRTESMIEAASQEINALKGIKGGTVTIGVVSTAKYFAPRLIHAFMKLNPEIEIRLVVGNRKETVEELKTYGIDVAIMGRPPDGIVVSKAAFGPHPYVAIARPDHPLAGAKRALDRSCLAQEQLLLREEGSGSRVVFEEFVAGLRRAELPMVEFGSNETIKQAVMAGLGLAVISAHTIELEIETGRLVVLNIKDLPVVREWNLVHRMDKKLAPAADAFWRFALKDGREFLPRIPGVK